MKRDGSIQTSKGLVLMLGGFLYDLTEKQQRKTTFDKKTIAKDLKRWKNDFSQFQKAFIDSKTKLYHCELPKLTPTLDENMYLINKFFSQPAASYVLFWSGHGIPETGDWSISEKHSITFQNILEAWYQGVGYPNNKLLLIIVNSCYSGAWISQIKDYMRNGGDKASKLKLAIQVGCTAEEESFVQTENLVDDLMIGSLLIRKMVHDKINLANQQNIFVWTHEKQHPTFYVTPNVEAHLRIKDCDVTGEKFCYLNPLHCTFRLSRIESSWSINKQGTQATFINKNITTIKKGKFS
ncbi:hypothetical protein AKO1_012610 [Acrasis kona]|uniref:Uncharacterized protein n=1 Tax=Acrasis kona TaxID=1008807 RepID=A0AAW2YWG5_9EUKA